MTTQEIILNNNDPFVKKMLNKHNPFGLANEDGKSMVFDKPEDAYLHLMFTALKLAPKGYIEMPLFLHKLYSHLDYRVCTKVCSDLEPFDIDLVFFTPTWDSEDAKKFFKALSAGLCSIVGSTYSDYFVDLAWPIFVQRIITLKEMNNLNQTGNAT